MASVSFDDQGQPALPSTSAVMDLRGLRHCLGHFATGVTVVTAAHAGQVHGATVNAFTSVSMAPPLILVSVDKRSKICPRLDGASFGVNILSAGQIELGLHFAGRRNGPLVDVQWEQTDHALKLGGCAAFLMCTPWKAYDGGDHVLYLGEVQRYEFGDQEPLIFHRAKFRELSPVPEGIAWRRSLDGPWFGAWQPGQDYAASREFTSIDRS